MDDSIVIAAVISAVVSLLIASIGFIIGRWTINRETERAIFQTQRKMTEKLYDKRIDSYQRVFGITEHLRGDILFDDDLESTDILATRQELINWNQKYGFVMSDDAIKKYYNLRTVLKVKGKKNNLTPDTKKTIFAAKNQFRSQLRKDVGLLYIEERNESR